MRSTFFGAIAAIAMASIFALAVAGTSQAAQSYSDQYGSSSSTATVPQSQDQSALNNDQFAAPSDQSMSNDENAQSYADQSQQGQDFSGQSFRDQSDKSLSDKSSSSESGMSGDMMSKGMMSKGMDKGMMGSEGMAQCNCPTSTDLGPGATAQGAAPGDTLGQIREMTIAIRGLNSQLSALERQQGLRFDTDSDSFVAINNEHSRAFMRDRDGDFRISDRDRDRDDLAFVPRRVAHAKKGLAPAKSSSKAIAGKKFSQSKKSLSSKSSSKSSVNNKKSESSSNSKLSSGSSSSSKSTTPSTSSSSTSSTEPSNSSLIAGHAAIDLARWHWSWRRHHRYYYDDDYYGYPHYGYYRDWDEENSEPGDEDSDSIEMG